MVEEDTDQILGAHLVGPNVDEVINLFGLAIRQGLTADAVKTTMLRIRQARQMWVTCCEPVSSFLLSMVRWRGAPMLPHCHCMTSLPSTPQAPRRTSVGTLCAGGPREPSERNDWARGIRFVLIW
jgi:hypothetical protein